MSNNNFSERLLDLITSLAELAQEENQGRTNPETKPAKGYLSTKKAAEYLGVTIRSLFNYRQNGLKCYVIGRKVLFLESDLDDFVQRFGIIRERR